jgi:N-acetylmuramoyl-L-alanine amidase
MVDPAAKVSAHYCVDEDGTVFRLVAETARAWHAGVAHWRGHDDINGRSVGIEIVNPGHEFGYRPFPAPQMAAVVTLCKEIIGRWPIPPRNVVGHSDVAPERKTDPGELFDWPGLAARGIGLFPDTAGRVEPIGDDVTAVQEALRRYGYGIEVTGTADNQTAAVVTAFQRHFRPVRVDGAADGETRAALAALLAVVAAEPAR